MPCDSFCVICVSLAATIKHARTNAISHNQWVGVLQEVAAEIDEVLRKAMGTSFVVSLVMQLVGLGHVRDSVVGDAMLRGLSGGERKRLTTAEMLVGQFSALFMDEISTGLDSATLYSIINMLRTVCARNSFITVAAVLPSLHQHEQFFFRRCPT